MSLSDLSDGEAHLSTDSISSISASPKPQQDQTAVSGTSF